MLKGWEWFGIILAVSSFLSALFHSNLFTKVVKEMPVYWQGEKYNSRNEVSKEIFVDKGQEELKIFNISDYSQKPKCVFTQGPLSDEQCLNY